MVSSHSIVTPVRATPGPIEPAALLRKLRAVMASVSDYVNGIRAQRIVESEDRRIRQEQDAAYQQSLERDRKKVSNVGGSAR